MRKKTDSPGRLVVLELAVSIRVMKKGEAPESGPKRSSELNQECSFGVSRPQLPRGNFHIIKYLVEFYAGCELAETVH